MRPLSPESASALTAWLILPSDSLRKELTGALPAGHAFQALAEERSYPAPQTVEIRLRQLQPDVVMIDVTANPAEAETLLHALATRQLAAPVLAVGADASPDEAVRWLRAGAADYLGAPFTVETQREIGERVRRLRGPQEPQGPSSGAVLSFCSSKPGAGSSSLAVQTAIQLATGSSGRVLLLDLDYAGGSASSLLGDGVVAASVASALSDLDLALSDWTSMTSHHHGVDLLSAPSPGLEQLSDFHRLHELLDFSRSLYDWVVLDLPSIFQRLSLFVLSESDCGLLVTTPELPSLHFTRRAFEMLRDLGFDLAKIRLLENQADSRGQLSAGDLAKLLNCKVYHSLPKDVGMAALVGPAAPNGAFGKALRALAGKLAADARTPEGAPANHAP